MPISKRCTMMELFASLNEIVARVETDGLRAYIEMFFLTLSTYNFRLSVLQHGLLCTYSSIDGCRSIVSLLHNQVKSPNMVIVELVIQVSVTIKPKELNRETQVVRLLNCLNHLSKEIIMEVEVKFTFYR